MSNFNTLTIVDIEHRLYTVDVARKTEQFRLSRTVSLLQRFLNLNNTQQEIARYGLERHFYYCERQEVEYNVSAIYEILNDARNGISIAKVNQDEMDAANEFNITQSGYSVIAGMVSHGRKKNKYFTHT